MDVISNTAQRWTAITNEQKWQHCVAMFRSTASVIGSACVDSRAYSSPDQVEQRPRLSVNRLPTLLLCNKSHSPFPCAC
jgi:hypothetical protein